MADKLLTLEGAQTLYNDLRKRLGVVPADIDTELKKKIDSASVENGYLVLYANGVPVGEPLGPFNGTGTGGGGGGSPAYTTITMKNLSFKDESGIASTSKTLTPGADCNISFQWESLLDGEPTGYGTLRIQVGTKVVKTANIPQGEYTENIKDYLPTGQSTVVVSVTDTYGGSRRINFNINVVAFSLKSTFDYTPNFVEPITYRFIATGTVDKLMHFLIDGEEIDTMLISEKSSGRQSTYIIPMQSHGAHSFEAYFTAEINGEAVQSNHLYYDIIFLDRSNKTPIIASDFTTKEVPQFSVISLTYRVYTPGYGVSKVYIKEYLNDKLVHTYERTDNTKEQTFSYRAASKGKVKLVIETGSVSREFQFDVTESNLNLNPKSDHLLLHLNSYGRSNSESLETRNKWIDEASGLEVELKDFNWSSNGWYVSEDHPYPSLRISSGAYIDIPFKPFATPSSDANKIQNTGYTIEFEFEMFNVDNYNTPVITCMNDGIGFNITAQNAYIYSRYATIGSQYKDNEHVRVAFVISPRTADSSYDSNGTRIMYIYLNGVVAGTVQYSESETESFEQKIPQTIRIGSNEAEIDLYHVRIYNTDLSRREIVGNWIADMQDSDMMLKEYYRNDIYNDNDGVSIDPLKLPQDLPYLLVDTNGKGLATSKTDKKIISGYFIDPMDKTRDSKDWKSFKFEGAEMVTQGTSSQAYPIKNFKIKFGKGFHMAESEDGNDPKVWTWKEEVTKKISLLGGVKTKTFVFKADFASSEGANNVELTNYYDELVRNVYLTPAQKLDPKVRVGINGFPIVMFMVDNDTTKFIGKYNFNNHKGTEEVYGLSYQGQFYDEDDYSELESPIIKKTDKEGKDEYPYLTDEKEDSRIAEDEKAYPLIYESGITDESWEVTDNNNQITRWKRVAGTGNENLTVFEDEVEGFEEVFVEGDSYEGKSESNPKITSAYYHEGVWYELKQATKSEYDTVVEDFRESFKEGGVYHGTSGEEEVSRIYHEGSFYEDEEFTKKDEAFVVSHAEGVAYNGSSVEFESLVVAYYHEGVWYANKTDLEFEYLYEVADFVRSYTDGAQYNGLLNGKPSSAFYHEGKWYAKKTGTGKETDRAIVGYTLKNENGEVVSYSDYVKGDNISVCKSMVERIRDGQCPQNILEDYFENLDFYDSEVTGTGYVQLWRQNTITQDIDAWVEAWKLFEFDILSSSLSSLSTDEKAQRTFLLFAIKAMIRTAFQLESTPIYADPSEDMLGTWGGGEFASHAFEVRFPSEWYDAHTEGKPRVYRPDRFLGLQEWVVSTDPDQETNEPLEKPVTYANIVYTKDNKEYRLAKFKAELKNYFDVNSCLFYYLFTEAFLMIDSRVKNSFPTYFAETEKVPALDEEGHEIIDVVPILDKDGNQVYDEFTNEPVTVNVHHYVRREKTEKIKWADGRETDWPIGRWCWFPYDMDTANGINNEGKLVFSYDLEDIDHIGKSTVFNGQDATLWSNIRKCFMTELSSLYIGLRAGNFGGKEFSTPFSYEEVERRFEEHQHKWPAMVFNDDAYYKYILPLLEREENRLDMCLGSKEQQRKWWLSNRFNYLDSKYKAGNFNDTNAIQFRAYRPGRVSITPYISMYATVKVGEAFEARERVDANQTLSVSLKNFNPNDTESFLYLADQLKYVDDMGTFDPDTVDISKAVRLQRFDISAEEGTVNEHLENLAVGNNTQLKIIKCDNCINLGSSTLQTLSLKGCKNLEYASFKNTQLKGVEFADGGILKEVYFPSTITSLSFTNQEQIEVLDIQGFGEGDFQLKSINLDNVSEKVKERTLEFLNSMDARSKVRLRGFDLEFDTLAEADRFIRVLDTMIGIGDTNGGNAEIQGTIKVNEPVDYEYIQSVLKGKTYKGYTYKGYVELQFDCVVRKTINFYNEDGSQLLETKTTLTNVVEYTGAFQTKEAIVTERYEFHNKWSLEANGEDKKDVLTTVETDLNLYAYFDVIPRYTVNFYSYDSETLLDTQVCDALTEYTPDGGKVVYGAEIPSAGEIDDKATFEGWSTDASLSPIEGILDDISAERVNENNVLNLYAIMEWTTESIWIEKEPDNVLYCETEVFDPTGMIVKARKKYLGEIEIFDYSYPTEPFTSESTVVEIGYKGLTTELEIGIGTSIRVSKRPNIRVYVFGDAFDPTGTELEITYRFGKGNEERTGVISEGYDYSPKTEIYQAGDVPIIFTYRDYLTCTYGIYLLDSDPSNLEDTPWGDVAALASEGLAPNYWNVGQKKSLYLSSGSDSIFHEGWYTFRILGFDHNIDFEKKGGHTVTFGLAGIGKLEQETLEDGTKKDLPVTEFAFKGAFSSYNMDDASSTSSNSWKRDCQVRKRLNNQFMSYLPSDLKNAIATVHKAQGDYSFESLAETVGGYSTDVGKYCYYGEVLEQDDKVFIPSLAEIYGSSVRVVTENYPNAVIANPDGVIENPGVVVTYNEFTETSEGYPMNAQYEYYKNSSASDKIKKTVEGLPDNPVYTNSVWFTRSGYGAYIPPLFNGSVGMPLFSQVVIQDDGKPGMHVLSYYNISTDGIVPCFAL